MPVVTLHMGLEPFSSLDAGTPEPSDSDCIGGTGAEARGAGDDHTRGEVVLEADSYPAVRIKLGATDVTYLV